MAADDEGNKDEAVSPPTYAQAAKSYIINFVLFAGFIAYLDEPTLGWRWVGILVGGMFAAALLGRLIQSGDLNEPTARVPGHGNNHPNARGDIVGHHLLRPSCLRLAIYVRHQAIYTRVCLGQYVWASMFGPV